MRPRRAATSVIKGQNAYEKYVQVGRSGRGENQRDV